jgi:hypothetical protein
MFKEAPEPLGLQDEKREGEAPGGDSEEGGASLASPHPFPGNIEEKASLGRGGGSWGVAGGYEAEEDRGEEEEGTHVEPVARLLSASATGETSRRGRCTRGNQSRLRGNPRTVMDVMEQQQLQQALQARQQYATAAAHAIAMGQQQQQQHALQARSSSRRRRRRRTSSIIACCCSCTAAPPCDGGAAAAANAASKISARRRLRTGDRGGTTAAAVPHSAAAPSNQSSMLTRDGAAESFSRWRADHTGSSTIHAFFVCMHCTTCTRLYTTRIGM